MDLLVTMWPSLPTVWQLDPTPEPDDVVAGWGAFGLFGLGILAIALLGWSLVRQLRKVDAAEEAGLYDPTTRKPKQGAPQSPGNQSPINQSPSNQAAPGRGLNARQAPQQRDPDA